MTQACWEGDNEGERGGRKKLRTKRLLQILKYQGTVSPFPQLTVLSKPENEKNSDTVDRTQLTMSAQSKVLQIKMV
jgi:hypothetical protein